ncbi:MAG: hypothetical protein R8J94_05045 [Acidimicrobiia bacterium]|nr:hypothetical protein [Acidimicrobiia bacterium]
MSDVEVSVISRLLLTSNNDLKPIIFVERFSLDLEKHMVRVAVGFRKGRNQHENANSRLAIPS